MRVLRLISIFVIFLFLIQNSNAQDLITIKHSCSFDGEETDQDFYVFNASNEADQIVGKILDAFNVSKNFIVKSADCKNALATVDGRQRFILYNTSFLEDFKKDAKTKWAAYCVMAHEIGHHFNNHDFEVDNKKKRKVMELQADKFAGGVLFMLGATLDEAKVGIEILQSKGESDTHPPARARAEAIANGWKNSQERYRSITEAALTVRANENEDSFQESKEIVSLQKNQNSKTYKSGDKYVGQFNEKQEKHGQGNYYWNNGNTFEGEFRNDKLYEGTLVYKEFGRYVGKFNEKEQKHGQGNYYWNNGNTFEGQFRNGKLYKGTKVYKDFGSYVGQFNEKEEKHGQGNYYWNDGNTFVGEFRDDKLYEGTLVNKVFGRYVGKFNEKEQKHGQGNYYWNNGNTFVGQFRNGKLYEGTLVYKDFGSYVGQFNEKEQQHGRGKYYWNNGDTFNGEFRNDKLYEGTLFYQNGKEVKYYNGIKG